MTADPWLQLADDYAAHRSGYSNELYDVIANFGLKRGAEILDVGCGTGIASEPFVANGFSVTGVDPSAAMLEKAKERLPAATFVQGAAEALPLPDRRFDVAISTGVFHWVDRARALAEVERVLRPGGIVAIWWKHLMDSDPVKILREDVFHGLGKEPPKSGPSAGFKEFYGSQGLVQQTLRVIPWRTSMPLGAYMGYERSRLQTRLTLGDQTQRYLDTLELRLRERSDDADQLIPLGYMQYLYLAKKR